MRAHTRKSAQRLAAVMAHMAATVTAYAMMAFATIRVASRVATGCPPYIAIPICAFVIMIFLAVMVPIAATMAVTARSATEAMDWTKRSRKST